MADIFANLDLSDLLNLRKFYKNGPAQFNRVAVGVVNAGAFGSRGESKSILKNKLIIRNDRFLNTTLQVQKANTRTPIQKAEARMGSVKRDRFTGWLEHETGERADKTRAATLFGRDLSPFKAMPLSNRLRRGSIISPDRYKGINDDHRSIVMINSLKRRNYKRTFIVKGNRKFKPGLYKLDNRNKIRSVQRFDQTIRPKRIRWLTNGPESFYSKNTPQSIWAKEMKFVLRF